MNAEYQKKYLGKKATPKIVWFKYLSYVKNDGCTNAEN